MGVAPVFQVMLSQPFDGREQTFIFNRCQASKLSLPTKQDDFQINEMDFMAFPDIAGQSRHDQRQPIGLACDGLISRRRRLAATCALQPEAECMTPIDKIPVTIGGKVIELPPIWTFDVLERAWPAVKALADATDRMPDSRGARAGVGGDHHHRSQIERGRAEKAAARQ